MYKLLAIFSMLFSSLVLFAQEEDISQDTMQITYQQWEQNYITKPNPIDTTCISEINRAKSDVEDGKVVFTQDYGFLFGEIRYENELRQLCKDNGLLFDFDLISDVVFEGQTQGCYGAYMDKIIADKFGSNFKENLHKKADSLFLLRTDKENIIVQYWDCDERPRLPSEEKRTSDYLPSIKIKELEIIKDESDYGGWPFFDLGFIVEKDSTISSFHNRYWVSHLETNERFKTQLYDIAVDYIKTKYPKWIPGKVLGVPVRTDNNVRIHFVKE